MYPREIAIIVNPNLVTLLFYNIFEMNKTPEMMSGLFQCNQDDPMEIPSVLLINTYGYAEIVSFNSQIMSWLTFSACLNCQKDASRNNSFRLSASLAVLISTSGYLVTEAECILDGALMYHGPGCLQRISESVHGQ